MLKALRITLATAVFMAVALLFLDITGLVASKIAFIADIQLIPALLATNVAAIAAIALVTFLAGRWYCSVLCPLGIWQDVLARIASRFDSSKKRKSGRYGFSAPHTAWRITFLVIAVLLFVAGFAALIPASYGGMLDPYSIWGRTLGQLVAPVWRVAAERLANGGMAHGVYMLDRVPAQAPFTLAVAIVAAVSILAVSFMAWRSGRLYCNSVCPVGTLLGFASRYALLRPVINESKCNKCGSCARHCKSGCIDSRNGKIDLSRCVDCMDCIGTCSRGAISYTVRPRRKASETPELSPDTTQESRRTFIALTATAVGTAALKAADKTTDGGLAPLLGKRPAVTAGTVIPAGAWNLRAFRSKCTACQLCVSACPEGVLKPSVSLEGFMQPHLEFSSGYCRPDCHTCSDICPTGALSALEPGEKTAVKTGTATAEVPLCIMAQGIDRCGACLRACPAGAISYGEHNGHRRPVVDESRCIGCGACEFVCPVGNTVESPDGHAAIYVSALQTHRRI